MEPGSLPITIGCHVELNLIDRAGNLERLSIDIVEDENADFRLGFLGAQTPLARIISGEKAGTVIPYLKDDIHAIEILSVTPSTSKPPEDAKEKRQTRMNKTRQEIEHTSAVVFASSFSGKWGDYDPDSIPKDGNAEEENSQG